MKGRVIALDLVSDRRARAALIVDGRLEDLLIDPADPAAPRLGQICAAVVDRKVPSAGAVFAALPGGQTAYVRDAARLQPGQRVIVQISGYPEPGKACPASAAYLLKGRLAILTPGKPGVNVARTIRKPELRERLQALGSAALSEHGHPGGLILRSEAAAADDGAIAAEIAALIQDEATVRANFAASTGPAALLPARADWQAEREWLTDETDVVTRAGLGADPFEHFGIWEEIARLGEARVDLPSGGWMAIEATRAMVTVDVNTGDQFSAGAGMTASVEAVRALPRQLRLRGLGGVVVIDFAPIKKMHRRKIEEEAKRAFAKDPVATSLAGWTPLGHFELQRRRERQPIAEALGEP